MDELRTIVPKNVFLSITWEPIVPSSEFRVPNSERNRCGLRTIVAKNVFLLITWEPVFYQNTEQNGPLVLKWNHLFRVPNSERNKLDLKWMI